MEYLLGIDNGGTVTKAALYDSMGKEGFLACIKKPETPKKCHTQRDQAAVAVYQA